MREIKLDLQNVTAIDQGLWSFDQLFAKEDFEYVQEQVLSTAPETYTESPASDKRHELTWVRDGILEELTDSIRAATPIFRELTGMELNFAQVRVWKDFEGYMIPFHEDDQISAMHFQVYIDSAQGDIGTTWYTTKGRHTCPFTPNTGYITICKERLPHGMLNPVEGKTRYSLYATFTIKS